MDPSLALNPYFQVGMVGAFMAFTLTLAGFFVRHMSGRDREARSERVDRDKDWREFLTQERDTRRDDSERIVQQLGVNTNQLTRVAEILTRHDERTRAAAAKIMAAEAVRIIQEEKAEA